jgi:3-hydroxybutyryl-CoA dehydrogenase
VNWIPSLAETVQGAALVVEAVVERPDVKRALYAQLETIMAPDAILASNTSNLDIFPLVPEGLKSRTIIAHWYTPPYLCDLVDLCPGPGTKPGVIETVREIVAAMGKAPVVFKQMVQGYVANRLQAAMQLEVYRLLDEGLVTPKDIDDSVLHGLALRIPILGIMAKADFTGLLLMQQGMKNRSYTPPVPRDHSETLDALIAEGRSGVMAGKGYFDWGDRTPKELFQERDRKLLALKQALRAIGPMEGK